MSEEWADAARILLMLAVVVLLLNGVFAGLSPQEIAANPPPFPASGLADLQAGHLSLK